MHDDERKEVQNHYAVALPSIGDHLIEIDPRLRCRLLRILHFLLSRIEQRISVPIRDSNDSYIAKQKDDDKSDSDP